MVGGLGSLTTEEGTSDELNSELLVVSGGSEEEVLEVGLELGDSESNFSESVDDLFGSEDDLFDTLGDDLIV